MKRTVSHQRNRCANRRSAGKRTNALAGQADREREKGRTTENKEANVTVACTTKSSKESKSDIRVRDVSCTAPVVRHPGGKKTNERKKGGVGSIDCATSSSTSSCAPLFLSFNWIPGEMSSALSAHRHDGVNENVQVSLISKDYAAITSHVNESVGYLSLTWNYIINERFSAASELKIVLLRLTYRNTLLYNLRIVSGRQSAYNGSIELLSLSPFIARIERAEPARKKGFSRSSFGLAVVGLTWKLPDSALLWIVFSFSRSKCPRALAFLIFTFFFRLLGKSKMCRPYA